MEKVTRRQFLALATLMGTSAVLSTPTVAEKFNLLWFLKGLFNVESSDWPEHLSEYKLIRPRLSLPKGLNGVYANAPFLYSQESREKILLAKSMNANRIRVLINDDFEPKIGSYDLTVLEKVSRLAATVKFLYEDSGKNPAGLVISLFDCYTLGNALMANPVYDTSFVNSAYNPYGTWPGYGQFFTDKNSIEAFHKRIRLIIRSFRKDPSYKISNLAAWSVANEPLPLNIFSQAGYVIPETEAKGILTDWYRKAVAVIRHEDPDTPVLAGTRNPWDIDPVPGLTATTAHIYPLATDLDHLGQFLADPFRTLPVDVEEIGFPKAVLGKKLPFGKADDFFYSFFEDVVSHTFKIDKKNKTVCPGITSIGGWQLGCNNDDQFDFDMATIPRTWSLLADINQHVFLPLN